MSRSDDLPRTVELAWLGLFLVQAAVQLLALAVPALGGLAGLLGGMSMLAVPLVLLLFVVLPRVSWSVPLTVALLVWQVFGGLPLPALLLDLGLTVAIISLVELVLVAPLFVWARRRTPRAPTRSALRSLGRLAALLVLALVGVVVQGKLAAWSVSLGTGGYVRVDGDGLETGRRVCTRDGRTVHLVGAIHVGESSGYSSMLAHVPDGALVLAEGVTDDEGKLGERFGYDRLAAQLGLVPQRSAGEDPGGDAEGGGRLRVRRADVDVSRFSPETLELLRNVGEALGSEDPLRAWLMESATGSNVTEAAVEGALQDILLDRNEHVLGEIDAALGAEPVIVVPWGALHLRGIQDGLEERGFACGEAEYTRMLRWSTVLQALGERMSGTSARPD